LQPGQAVFESKPHEEQKSFNLPAQCNVGNELRREIQQQGEMFKIRSQERQIFKSEVASIGFDLPKCLFVFGQSMVHFLEMVVMDGQEVIDGLRMCGRFA